MRERDKRFWKGTALVSTEMLAAMLLFSGAVVGVVFLLRPRVRRFKPLDNKVFDVVKHVTNKNTNRLMLAITHLGNHKFLIPANLALIFYFLYVRKHTWFSIRVVAIALSSLGLMLLFKQTFRRKRPAIPLLHAVGGLSFPSGHAMMSLTFYGLMIYIINRTIKNPTLKISLISTLTALIASIGFSRVYLRVHYASDVLSGFIIGGSWLGLSLKTIKKLEPVNKEIVASPTPLASPTPPLEGLGRPEGLGRLYNHRFLNQSHLVIPILNCTGLLNLLATEPTT